MSDAPPGTRAATRNDDPKAFEAMREFLLNAIRDFKPGSVSQSDDLEAFEAIRDVLTADPKAMRDFRPIIKGLKNVPKDFAEFSKKRDELVMQSWVTTLDVLLVFAGLFSAIVTAFLNPLLSQANSDTPTSEQTQTSAKTPTAALNRLANVLWFISLIVVLSVAFLSILAKQWVGQYALRTASNYGETDADWIRRRAPYRRALAKWHMPLVLSILPLLLHISMFLFVAGLAAFLQTFDRVLFGLSIGTGGAMLLWYLVSGAIATLPNQKYWPFSIPIFTAVRHSLYSELWRQRAVGLTTLLAQSDPLTVEQTEILDILVETELTATGRRQLQRASA